MRMVCFFCTKVPVDPTAERVSRSKVSFRHVLLLRFSQKASLAGQESRRTKDIRLGITKERCASDDANLRWSTKYNIELECDRACDKIGTQNAAPPHTSFLVDSLIEPTCLNYPRWTPGSVSPCFLHDKNNALRTPQKHNGARRKEELLLEVYE